jgi:hypothetical protein
MALPSRDCPLEDPGPVQRPLDKRELDLQLHGRYDYTRQLQQHRLENV